MQDTVLFDENIQDDDEEDDEEESGSSGDGDERHLFHKKTRMADLVNKHFIIRILIIYRMFR